MRKVLFMTIILATIIFMNCDDNLGLGNIVETPENVFANSEWENKNYNWQEPDKVTQYFKLSFTDTEFTFYRNSVFPQYEDTFTGTYSLFYEDKIEMIEFTSSEPTVNGNGRYFFYSASSVQFVTPDNFPIGGIYTKVHHPET